MRVKRDIVGFPRIYWNVIYPRKTAHNLYCQVFLAWYWSAPMAFPFS